MSPRLRPLLWPAVATVVATTMLVSLGVWQLHRLAWKEAILAQIDSRTKAAPQPLPPRADWPGLKPDDYEYRRVTLAGTYATDKEALVFRGTDSGPGYLVMTPLTLDGGGTVIVDRGWVPVDRTDKAARAEPTGHVTVTGLMREPEARNLFTPGDQPDKGAFFTRDPAVLAAHAGLTDAAPFTVDADATPNPGGWPRGGATVIAIPNNHFSYALTWFGLALGLVGVFVSFAIRRLSEAPADAAAAAPPRREAHRLS